MPFLQIRSGLGLLHAAAAVLLLAAARPAPAWVTPADPAAQLTAVGSDSAGNALVAGSLSPTFDQSSLYVAKYSPGGTLIWSAEEPGGTFETPSGASALLVDKSGDVLVTGTAAADGLDGAFVVLRYDGDTGQRLWRTVVRPRISGALAGNGSGSALALSRTGRLVVGGSVTSQDVPFGTAAGLDSRTGALVWTWSGDFAPVRALAVDRSGRVALTGPFLAARLDGQTGRELWRVDRSPTPIGVRGAPQMRAVGTDDQGNVVVGGALRNSQEDTRTFYLVSLAAANGAVRWEFAGQPRPSLEGVTGLELASNGGIFAGGCLRGAPAVLHFSKRGALDWSRSPWTESFTKDIQPAVSDIALDASSVFGCGSENSRRFRAVRYARAGGLGWRQDLGPGAAVALTPAAGSRLYLVGFLTEQDGPRRAVIAGFRVKDGKQLAAGP